MRKFSPKDINLILMLIVINIALTRLFSFQTGTIRIGLGFLPIAICAIIYGPIVGGISALTGDVTGSLFFGKSEFMLGMSFTVFMKGVVYGFFLNRKKVNLVSVSIAVLIVTIVLETGLNTLFLSYKTHSNYFLLLPHRMFKSALMIPIQLISITTTWNACEKFIHDYISGK